jgi:cytochrome P450
VKAFDIISALAEVRTPPYERFGYVVTPHKSTSFDPTQWKDPETFNPDRYNTAPTSHEINDAKCDQTGFARCPSRKAAIHNSGFGTTYGIVDGKALPVRDHAGFAPYGFGYRRCPGEQLTIQVFEDFLRKVWKSGRHWPPRVIA